MNRRWSRIEEFDLRAQKHRRDDDEENKYDPPPICRFCQTLWRHITLKSHLQQCHFCLSEGAKFLKKIKEEKEQSFLQSY